ncbi:hypothetical protein GMMP15_1500023 [Candidatus Magnetomoraceae bacterium gMMP-15]
MVTPSLSIAVPTYNRANYLKTFLTHLSSWKSFDFEVVISDNCSSDETPEVIKKFSKHLNIRSIRQIETIEVGCNFTAAYQNACGDYLFIVGDDDVLIEESILYAINIMKNDPNIVAVYGSAQYREHLTDKFIFNDMGSTSDKLERINLSNVEYIFDKMYVSEIFVVRREIFQRFCYFEKTGLILNWRFMVTLLEHGDVILIPNFLMLKYLSEDSGSYKSALSQSYYLSDFESFYATLRKNYDHGKIKSPPNINILFNKFLKAYEAGRINSLKLNNFLDSHHQVMKIYAWKGGQESVREWEQNYLIHAAAERITHLINLLHNIKTVIFENCKIGLFFGNILSKERKDIKIAYLHREEIISYSQQDDEFIFVQEYSTLQERISFTNTKLSHQRSLMDIIESCSVSGDHITVL